MEYILRPYRNPNPNLCAYINPTLLIEHAVDPGSHVDAKKAVATGSYLQWSNAAKTPMDSGTLICLSK